MGRGRRGRRKMSSLFDDVSRIVASPIPRRQAFRLLSRAVGSAVLASIGLGRASRSLGAPQGDGQGTSAPCGPDRFACGRGCCDSRREECCRGRCIPRGHKCCPDGHDCPSTHECCRDRCMPRGHKCCDDGHGCPPTHECCRDRCVPRGHKCCDDGHGCGPIQECCGTKCCDPGFVCCPGNICKRKRPSGDSCKD